LKRAEDGEILCKRPNVMMVYYKRPDLTIETVRMAGFTREILAFARQQYLKITDRKKEIFKTSEENLLLLNQLKINY
jgi:long-chain acyl-CoA synthetase